MGRMRSMGIIIPIPPIPPIFPTTNQPTTMKPETIQLLDPKLVLISKLNTRQPKKAEYCDHGKSIAIQSGQPVACSIHKKTFPADHTCERWEIILHNAKTEGPAA